MKKLIIGALALCVSAMQAMAGCTLPTSASTRIGRGQFFPGSLSASQFTGTRDWLWSNSNHVALDSSVHGGYYHTGERSPTYTTYASTTTSGSNISGASTVNVASATGIVDGTIIEFSGYHGDYTVSSHTSTTVTVTPVLAYTIPASTAVGAYYTLGWYKTNHPDWIVYAPDRKTPAYEFCTELDSTCDGRGHVPLATWVGAVQTHLKALDIADAIAHGPGTGTPLYNAMSADNVSVANVYYRAGTCSVAVDPALGACDSVGNGGTWTSRYDSAATTTTGTNLANATTINVANGNVFVDTNRVEIPGAGTAGALHKATVSSHTSTTITLSSSIKTTISAGTAVTARMAAASTTNGSHSNGSTVITLQTGAGDNFVPGMRVRIKGAGTSGGLHQSSIASQTANTITLNNATITTVASGASVEGVMILSQAMRDDWQTWLAEWGKTLRTSNMCLNANLSWASDRTGWQQLVDAVDSNSDPVVDIIVDEGGPNGSTNSCTNASSSITDSRAVDYIGDIISRNTKAYAHSAAGCTPGISARDKVQYNVAWNMLIKGSHTYAVPHYVPSSDADNYKNTFEDFWWLYYLDHGAASEVATQISSLFWRRTFANALALVNFDSVNSQTYTLGADYHLDDGRNYKSGATLTLPPTSGLVLLNGAATTALPLTIQ